jgi:hypothetical protein
MSGETAQHIRLVEGLIERIQMQFATVPRFTIFADHRNYGRATPQAIGAFRPDVYAFDLPTTVRVLGEAKTHDDILTERSQRQLSAFLDHLSLYPASFFFLAVPHYSLTRAQRVLRLIRNEARDRVQTTILKVQIGLVNRAQTF